MNAETPKPPVNIEMSWTGGLRFKATGANGVSSVLDSDSREGFSPMTGLLASLCSCMAIDVVMILEKMRLRIENFSIAARGERNPEPPRYFRRIEFDFNVEGDIPQERVERAIDLSFDKYCSVFHTLRQDIEIERRLTVHQR